MKNGPLHILDAEDFEPLYRPQINILEECLRREAERVAHQENLMNRVVFDCMDSPPTPGQPNASQSATKTDDDTDLNQPPQTSQSNAHDMS